MSETTNNYSVTIESVSEGLNLSAKERIMYKDTQRAVKIDEQTNNGNHLVITNPKGYLILNIHNEKSDGKNYKNYVIVDEGGNSFVTGASSFFDTFCDIFADMQGSGEDYAIDVYKLPSKNYKGKEFITCSIC